MGFNPKDWDILQRSLRDSIKAGTPGRRAKIIAALVQTANAFPDIADRTAALARIPVYRSRGKGRGSANRSYGNKPGKYTPHQGTRECARRVRQRVAAAGPRFSVPVA